MIKFFRKIRQNLLSENKTGKYFKYAIGEIVLVVIGILIALSINNWNEQVKKDKNIASVFETIKKDLISDIKEADEFIQFYEAKDSLVELVLNRKVSKEQYQNNPNFRTIVMWYSELSINISGYETLKENINDVPLKYENVLIDINFIYSEILQGIEVNNKSNRLLLERTLQKWADNYSWFRTSTETQLAPNDDMIDFFLNDSSYLGDVRMVKMLGIDNHLMFAKQFNSRAILSLFKIDQVNNISFEQSVEDLKTQIGSVELIPMNAIQEYMFKKVQRYTFVPTIINNSFKEKFFFYYRNAEGLDVLLPQENSIEPKTIASIYLPKDMAFIVKDDKGIIVGTFKPTSSYNCIDLKKY